MVANNCCLMEELSKYEIESVLLNRVGDAFPHHQKVIAIFDAFRDAVSNSIQKERAQKLDYAKKIKNNATIIADTSSHVKHVQNESATVVLQHKVLEKQINNTLKQQEKLREEIEMGLHQGESYALEIEDLIQEQEESRMKKQLRWDGMKRACDTYKSALQFCIKIIDSSEACEKIRIIFFKLQKDEDPQYYVDLTRTSDLWRVEFIHPPLKRKYEEKLECTNFKKHQEISELTTFLCVVRQVFKLHGRSRG